MSASFTDLCRYPQWVVWRWGADRGRTREKVPHDPRTGRRASVTDSQTWATFDEATQVVERYDGRGFVLTAADPFVGVDLDHCRNPETGAIEPWAKDIIVFLWSYTEVTPSGTGFRIFLRGTLPPSGRKRGQVEMYDRDRFLTVTGRHLSGAPESIENRDKEIRELHAHWFPVAERANIAERPTPTVEPVEERDRELLIRAFKAPTGQRFAELWAGNIAGYPSPSEADLALVSWLGHLTGGDAERVDRLFRQSGLYRPKWDERHGASTYGQRTISRALGSGPPSSPSPGRQLDVRCAADITPERVTWLWPGRIPAGKLTLLIGDPGMGKSLLTLDIIARVTTGKPWPDGGHAPLGGALVLSAEDAAEDTIVPRLSQLGADLARVFIINARRDGTAPNLSKDLAELKALIQEKDIRLVVFDPLSAYLGGTDSWKDAEVRSLLGPVAAMATETGVTIIGLLHLTKDTQRKAIHRALGSIAFSAAPRAVFTVAMDSKGDPADLTARRFFAPVKLNLAVKPPTLAFTLTAAAPDAPPALVWDPTPVAGVDVDRLLSSPVSGDDHEERRDAEDFLRELLADRPVLAVDVVKAARQNSIAERTLRRAKSKLGVKSTHEGQPGKPGPWSWYLPETANTPTDAANPADVAASDEHPGKRG